MSERESLLKNAKNQTQMCRTIKVAEDKVGGEREHECSGWIRSASDHLTRRDQRHLEGGPRRGPSGKMFYSERARRAKGS